MLFRSFGQLRVFQCASVAIDVVPANTNVPGLVVLTDVVLDRAHLLCVGLRFDAREESFEFGNAGTRLELTPITGGR